ncbi:MAG: 5'/3'-nucleotidase SurE [Anaerolineales bacterium]
MTKPLIVLTNDDGIYSKGLDAAALALAPLGEVLIVAPDRQWSGAGRSMPQEVTGKLKQHLHRIPDTEIVAYGVDASPALCVDHAILEIAPRTPDLVVSGINFGENLSTEVTISGTVGAALEAASFGIPALAVSLEMPITEQMSNQVEKDFAAAQAFTARFARQLLRGVLPYDTHILNINVPITATPETPWRLTRLARHRYYHPLPPDRDNGAGRPGYRLLHDPSITDPDSDIRALSIDRVVSVTPLSMDMTARTDFGSIEEFLHQTPDQEPLQRVT